jgi:hypothetical protein
VFFTDGFAEIFRQGYEFHNESILQKTNEGMWLQKSEWASAVVTAGFACVGVAVR